MRIEDIKQVAVVGAGTMGSQIGEAFSHVGKYAVTMIDTSDALVKQGIQSIEERLERFYVSKDKMTTEEKEEIMSRVGGTTHLEDALKHVQFVIEAIPEVMSLKQDIFAKLGENAPQALLASNTSTLNITEIASVTGKPENVIGMHFFNPVARMKLVEVVRGAHTSQETVDVVLALARKLGKDPVVCRDTSYGFLANRAYEALREEAVEMVWERVASPEDIDKALKLGYNMPVGPLELGDMLGSWGRRAEMEEDRMKELGPERGRLHPLIRMMVRAGYVGGPDKKGIYDFWKEVLSQW